MKIKKDIKFGRSAREELIKGMNILADAVGSTLGPLGRNVAINDPYVYPKVLHDGVSVAKQINLENDFQDMGAEILKAAAVRTNETAGDGTTTATILAQSIVNEAMKMISSGINPMIVKAQVEKSLKEILEELDKIKKPIASQEQAEQIATISSASPIIGKLVAEALYKVGRDGVVTVEEGKGLETTVEYKQGMEIDRGYLSQYFVTDQDNLKAVIDDPYILITDKKINNFQYEILPFLDKFVKTSKNLVIFASEVVEEGLAGLVINKMRGNLNVLAIQAPAFGDRRLDELEDIAVLTGGKVIANESGRTLESVEIEELGRAEKIVSDVDKTIIQGGKGNAKNRIDELREQIKVANTEFDKQIKEERLAKLSGGVAVINVGAATEIEMKEKKERVIDAVNATQVAIEDGVVAGGEITLYYLAKSSPEILNLALKAPFKKLLDNSGYDYAEVLQRLSNQKYPYGIDVQDGKVKNLLDEGIIDPVKVTKSALENAVSVSLMALTTDTLITDLVKDEK